jgi:hypothetical protein
VAGYQVLLIDPEGDHRGLRSLPRMMALSGDRSLLPAPAFIPLLLEESSTSVVLDLSAYPLAEREAYLADLFHRLHPLKARKYRPHWVVLEEAQQFLPPVDTEVSVALKPMLASGGMAFVTYRPDRMAADVRASLQHYLSTRLREPEVVQALTTMGKIPSAEQLAGTPVGYAWLCGEQLVRLHSAGRRVPHIRHLYKYLDIPLPRHKRFFFRTESGYLGVEAASLFEFKELLPTLPLASLAYHQSRGDFVKWARGALGDEVLAAHLDKLARRDEMAGEALRDALLQRVTDRYIELDAAR